MRKKMDSDDASVRLLYIHRPYSTSLIIAQTHNDVQEGEGLLIYLGKRQSLVE